MYNPSVGAWVPYLVICPAAAGYCYWSLICISGSGRRYRIVFLVDSGEALHIKDLVKLYGREAIIQERLKRLERWGKSPEREIASSVRGESV
jgi:hypothetical protein